MSHEMLCDISDVNFFQFDLDYDVVYSLSVSLFHCKVSHAPH